jgi:hypothetical protein
VIAPRIFIGGLAVRSGKFWFGLALATALSVSMFSGDAFQFCGPEIPDVDRVTACMIRNKSRLSAGCRAHFRAGPEPVAAAAPAGRPMSIKPTAPRKAVSAKAKKPKKLAKKPVSS